jgi:cell division protein FtsQ
VTGTGATPRSTGRAPQVGAPGRASRAEPGGAGVGGPRRRVVLTPPGRRTVLIGLILLTVLAGGGTWAVYGSSWFRATGVTVRGQRVLTAAQIERAAGVPLGGPLISVDTGAVRARLLRALPRIDRVSVDRSWPHTVSVTVVERTPSAVLRSGGRYTEVDRDGVRFATVDRAPAGVPLLQLAPTPSASLRHFGTKRLLQAAIAVAGDLPDSVRRQATAVRVRSYDGVTVELSGGREVMWGSSEDGPRKASVLTALMKAEPHATRFDVSAPTAPAAAGS